MSWTNRAAPPRSKAFKPAPRPPFGGAGEVSALKSASLRPALTCPRCGNCWPKPIARGPQSCPKCGTVVK